MSTSKHRRSALALIIALATGVANAVPHPTPGQVNPIDFQRVVRSLGDTGETELTANGASVRALPQIRLHTPDQSRH